MEAAAAAAADEDEVEDEDEVVGVDDGGNCTAS